MAKDQEEHIRKILKENGLKVTPQRTIILKAIRELKNHPNAEVIIEYIRKHHPNIATGTVYNVLETFTEKGIIRKVKTENDIMQYDGVLETHHHLYCIDTGTIEDYEDAELDKLLADFFKNKKIQGFHITDYILQINGTFTDK